MREALARSDHDFVLSAPARGRKPPPRRGMFGTIAAILRFIYHLAGYPNRIGGILLFCLTIAILVNALMLQATRHPAPLFRKSVTLSLKEPAAAAPQGLASDATDRNGAPATESAEPKRDPIAQLLKSEIPAPSETALEADKAAPAPHRLTHEGAVTSEVRPAAHDRIAQLLKAKLLPETPAKERPNAIRAVQRALIKLGFVVQPDGQMGALTRRAIEQYERDRDLPIEARLTPQLVHRLAAETGIAIE